MSWPSRLESKWEGRKPEAGVGVGAAVLRRLAGIPDFISGDDMDEMISSGRLDPKVVFAYVQEVYRALKDN